MILLHKGEGRFVVRHLAIDQLNLAAAAIALTALILHGNILLFQSFQQGLVGPGNKTVSILDFYDISHGFLFCPVGGVRVRSR